MSKGTYLGNKVPQLTIFFWVIKVLSTTVGETFADFINGTLNFGLTGTSLLMSAILIAALIFQFKTKKYNPAIYWSVVVLMSITGTLLTDNLTDNFGVSLLLSTAIFAILLLATFAIWYRKERTISIKNVNTRERESFYWLAILFTFALGTAAGDLVAERFNVGYGRSLLLFAAIILIFAILWNQKVIVEEYAFWIIYILTRPLGASSGDFLSQSTKDGGLGLGAANTSWIYLTIISLLVIYLVKSKKDQITS